ncbi:MAG TPA: hypothetical protein VF310_15150 [Vicinamibacteria bacterium]
MPNVIPALLALLTLPGMLLVAMIAWLGLSLHRLALRTRLPRQAGA